MFLYVTDCIDNVIVLVDDTNGAWVHERYLKGPVIIHRRGYWEERCCMLLFEMENGIKAQEDPK